MKLIVFSICKDEAETIGQVLDGVPKKIKGVKKVEKLVISDGSTDDTVKVAKKHGAKVYEGKEQKHLAYRFQQAADWALAEGADLAVGIDGDLQFNPADIPTMLRPILEENYDFVAADRFTDYRTGESRRPKNMPAGKYYGNKLGSWVVSKIARKRFRDVTCGFRAYNRRALLAININSNYTYTQESFQLLAMKRMNIASVPVEVAYYPERKSRVVTSLWKFIFGSAINIMRAFRDFAPLRFFVLAGAVPLVLGLAMGGFTFVHWLVSGSFSPYIFLGVTGLYLVTIGVLLWALGLVADMLGRIVKNQEKIIERQKDESLKD